MNQRGFWQLDALSDGALQAQLQRLLVSGARTEARVVAHLAEVDARKLHLTMGASSLFDYCLTRLELSNNEAFHRITAARLARKFPLIFELLERRAVHLTAVCLLRDYLTIENHQELLREASHKTKTQIEELLARRFPKPDVVSRLRKLTAVRPNARSLEGARAGVRAVMDGAQMATGSGAVSSETAMPGTAASSSEALASSETPASNAGAGSETPESSGVAPRPSAPRAIEPLSSASYRLQVNASARLKQKIDQARDLMSHANPSGDLAVLVERAFDALLERLKARRFAQAKRPRARAAEPATGHGSCDLPGEFAVQVSSGLSAVAADGKPTPRRAHLRHCVRREVVERDGQRCTFTSADGRRCKARAFLQFHHEKAWAVGGADAAYNLRLLCRAHNRLLAERELGAGRVLEAIEAKRNGEAKRT